VVRIPDFYSAGWGSIHSQEILNSYPRGNSTTESKVLVMAKTSWLWLTDSLHCRMASANKKTHIGSKAWPSFWIRMFLTQWKDGLRIQKPHLE
jgi:hypothetical protein